MILVDLFMNLIVDLSSKKDKIDYNFLFGYFILSLFMVFCFISGEKQIKKQQEEEQKEKEYMKDYEKRKQEQEYKEHQEQELKKQKEYNMDLEISRLECNLSPVHESDDNVKLYNTGTDAVNIIPAIVASSNFSSGERSFAPDVPTIIRIIPITSDVHGIIGTNRSLSIYYKQI
jgi:hypothetical protein